MVCQRIPNRTRRKCNRALYQRRRCWFMREIDGSWRHQSGRQNVGVV